MSKKEDDYYDKKINNFLHAFDSFEVVAYDEKTFEINQEKTDAEVTFLHSLTRWRNYYSSC